MKDISAIKSRARRRTRNIFIIISIGWTVLIAGLFSIYYHNEYEGALSSARLAAVYSLRKDLIYRKWASIHGGVYVPITEKTTPNQFMVTFPNRDIETVSGEKFTLMNPVYMNRQVNELGQEEFGIYGHITTLNPIRHENTPDDWERMALKSLEDGKSESSGLEMIAGSQYFRYMAPLILESSCLKCHADQNYKVGEVRGGIVVSIPWNEFHFNLIDEAKTVAGMYGIVWFLGLIGNIGARRVFISQIHEQEVALDALAKSEKTLNTVLQATSTGFGLVRDRVIQWTNDGLREITGYSEEELYLSPSKKFYESVADYERIGAIMYSEIAINGKTTIETRFRRKDGSFVEVLMNLAAIDKTDPSAGAVFSIMDISESKRMAKQLEENVLRMERAEVAAKFGNWEMDPQDDIVRLSPGASRIEGSQRSQIPLNELNELVLPEHALSMSQAWQDLIQNHKSYEVEFKFLRQSDQQVIHVQSIAGINAESGSFWGVIQDVTSRKKAEEELQKSEAKYRMLTENMKDVIWSTDSATKFTYISPSVLNLLGYEPEEMLQKTYFDLLTPENRKKFLPVYNERINAVGEYGPVLNKTYEIEVLRKDDSLIWVEVVSNPNTDDEGNLVGFQGVTRDISQRKRAEAALRQNEERLSLTLEVSSAGRWEWSIETDEVYFDERFHSMLGYEMGELPTSIKEWLPYHHQGDMTVWMSKAQEYLKGDRPIFESEHRIKSKTGDWKWVFTRGKLVDIGSSESQKRFVGMAMDITERKKAEEALTESEVLYRTLFEGARDGIIIIDMEGDSTGRIVSANPVAAELHGYSLDEFTTLSLYDLETTDCAKDLKARINTVLSGQQLRGEVNHRRKDGSVFPIEMSSNLVEISGHKYCIGIDRDISERKLAEEALRESENRFRSYVESSPIGIFESNAEGIIVSSNKAEIEIIGYSVEEAAQMTLLDPVAPQHLAKCREAFESVKRNGEVSLDTELVTAAGITVWVSINGVKLSDNRYLFFSQDITEQKRAQEELIEMERKLLQSQKLESLGVLSGGIAHDFNNLLAVIIGNIELAQDHGFSSSEKELFLERAMTASTRSARLVRQMLDYSGKGAFELNDVNLSELVQNNIDMFRMTVPKNIDLKVDSSNDDIFVKADLSQLQQVIMNLLINASEAIDGKTGMVEITTGAQYCGESLISKSLLPEKPEPQDMAFVRVRDDGIGMDPGTIARIFDPFFSTKFIGRGLGMSVVHGVVRGHSGALTIDSQADVGTTITVYLPLLYRTRHVDGAPDDTELATGLTDEKSPGKKKFSVLVVDDEQPVLDLVLGQLEHLGCETLSAKNGKEALEVFNENPEIDLVILDMVMPEMGGVETFDRLKELEPDLMVIICSGYNEEKIKDDFKSELKPTGFVTKPYRLSAMKDLLESLKGKVRRMGKPSQ